MSIAEAGRDTDDGAFLDLYERHLDDVYGFVRRRLSEADAQDVTAEVFHRALRAHLDGRGPIGVGWLIVTARNLVVDRWRRERTRDLKAPLLLPLPAPSTSVADDAGAVLDSLPDRYRAVLVLRYLDDRSVQETADALGLSLPATESLLARARRRFRTLYSELV